MTIPTTSSLRTASTTSSAATEATTTITMPTTGKKGRKINIWGITVTTKTADIGGDCDIVVNDNAVAVWAAVLRSGKVYGADFQFTRPIVIRDGDATIVVDSAGAAAVTVTSVIYEIV